VRDPSVDVHSVQSTVFPKSGTGLVGGTVTVDDAINGARGHRAENERGKKKSGMSSIDLSYREDGTHLLGGATLPGGGELTGLGETSFPPWCGYFGGADCTLQSGDGGSKVSQ